jgi:hypothetical protein
MNKLLAVVVASMFAMMGNPALGADPPKDGGGSKAAVKPAPERPANVTAEAWAKMTDAEKAKAVEATKKTASTKPAKKEKKGGC